MAENKEETNATPEWIAELKKIIKGDGGDKKSVQNVP